MSKCGHKEIVLIKEKIKTGDRYVAFCKNKRCDVVWFYWNNSKGNKLPIYKIKGI